MRGCSTTWQTPTWDDLAATARRTRLDYAATQCALGSAYAALPTGDRAENLQRAITCCREALEVFTPDEMPLAYALAQHNLGNAYRELPIGDREENLQQAIACHTDALRHRPCETHPWLHARTLVALGQDHAALPAGDRAANLHRALSCYEQALDVYTAQDAPLNYATVQANMGYAYAALETGDRSVNLQRAMACYDAALRFFIPECDPFGYAAVQLNLGAAYYDLDAVDREAALGLAIEAYRQALTVYTPDAAPQRYAMACNNLGNALVALEAGDRAAQVEGAIGYLEQALRFRTHEADPYHRAETLNNLGTAYAARPTGDREDNQRRAVEHLEQALALWRAEVAPAQRRIAARNLGNLHFDAGEWTEAHAAYDAAIRAGDRLYRASATEAARRAELVWTADVYANDAYCLARLGRCREAVERLEAGRARALSEALDRDRAALEDAPPLERAAFEAARERIAALEAEARAAAPTRSFADLSADLGQARRALEAAAERIRAAVPGFMSRGLEFEDIARVPSTGSRDASSPDCPLVYLVATSRGSLALIVPAGTHDVLEEQAVWLDGFSEDDLDELLWGADGMLVGQVRGDERTLRAALERGLLVLRERLMGPLASRLVALGFRRATLLPGGRLSLLPLHAAVLGEVTCAYAPSARALRAARQKGVQLVGLPHLLAVGNPQPGTAPLPFAQQEAEAAAAAAPGESRLLCARQATREAVLAALPGTTHLHFACHGAFDPAQPLDSRLVLARGEEVTLRDLLDGGLDLSAARLVVLSACQTGLVEYRQVPDEAVGLPAGLMQAGVPGVVSTLWPVADVSTAVLMARFQQYLWERACSLDLVEGRSLNQVEGCAPVEALRAAQRWLREATAEDMDLAGWCQARFRASGGRDRDAYRAMRYWRTHPDEIPFAHPYYWAGFTYTGAM